jgi:hypothetical protein
MGSITSTDILRVQINPNDVHTDVIYTCKIDGVSQEATDEFARKDMEKEGVEGVMDAVVKIAVPAGIGGIARVHFPRCNRRKLINWINHF